MSNPTAAKATSTLDQLATTRIVITGQASRVIVYTDDRQVYNRATQRRETVEMRVMEVTVNGKTFELSGQAAELAQQRGVVTGAYIKAIGERKARISYAQNSRHAEVHVTTRHSYRAPIKGIGAWKVRP